MDQPETRYVAVADADVAYQVVGDGDTDLLYCYGLGSHLEMFWEVPETADYLHRLAAFSRLIFFDRRVAQYYQQVFLHDWQTLAHQRLGGERAMPLQSVAAQQAERRPGAAPSGRDQHGPHDDRDSEAIRGFHVGDRFVGGRDVAGRI